MTSPLLRALIWAMFGVTLGATLVIPAVTLRPLAALAEQTAKDAFKARVDSLEGRLSLLEMSAALSVPETLRRQTDGLVPYVLPRDRFEVQKPAQRAVAELNSYGCEVVFPNRASVCVAVARGDTDVMGRLFIGVKFPARRLRQYMFKNMSKKVLTPPAFAASTEPEGAHRVELTLSLGNQRFLWTAPIQTRFAGGRPDWDSPLITAYRSLRPEEGRWTGVWIDQMECKATGDPDACERDTYFSAVIPREQWDAKFNREAPVPASVAAHGTRLRVRVLEPNNVGGSDDRVILDTLELQGTPRVAERDLEALLEPGEHLTLSRATASGSLEPLLLVKPRGVADDLPGLFERTGDWALRRIAELMDGTVFPDEGSAVSARLRAALSVPNIQVDFGKDGTRVIKRQVAAEAGWVVLLATMLSAVVGLAVVVGYLLRRVAADTVRDRERRVFELRREQERAATESRLLRSVKHEISGPIDGIKSMLQTKARGLPYEEEIQKYINRMSRAVEMFSAAQGSPLSADMVRIELETKDFVAYLRQIAENAEDVGVQGVTFVTRLESVPVRADFGTLADVFQNLLTNAGRYRLPGTGIKISLTQDDWEAIAAVRNQGPQIPEENLDRIFDLGFSEYQESSGHLGLGLFLAALYMNKMGGSVRARNVGDGVEFEVRLRRVDV